MQVEYRMKYDNLDVLILTYNRADYLKVQLDSVFQSTADWRETIVIDNASTDYTQEVIQAAMQKYPKRKVRIIRHESNIGNTGNFIFSQSVAENEYVAVFHDDDAIHPEYIDRAMHLLTENQDAVLCSGGAAPMYNVNNDNWSMLPDEYLLYPQSKAGAFAQLLLGRAMFMSAIYKSSAYKQVSYRPDLYGKLHDIVFLMEINGFGSAIFQLGTVVRWRQHAMSDSNRLSTGPFPEEILHILITIKGMLRKDKEDYKNLEKYDEIIDPLLYNFAYFIYKWSYLARYILWDAFREKMKHENLFNDEQYRMYDLYIDQVYNPVINREAQKMREECRHEYYFRVCGM